MNPIKSCLLFCLGFGLAAGLHAQGVAVKGRVIFEGTPPPAEKIEVKSDTAVCGNHQDIQKLVLGAEKGIANAVVSIIGPKAKPADVKGHLDQVHCEFVPHVQIIPIGSVVMITSSDAVLHNSHGIYEDGSTAFNIAVPVAGMELPAKITKAGIIKLRCDAGHTWMSGYIIATDHPYIAMTDANGNFTIENVPPGEYQIEVWQEWTGKQKQPVSVKAGAVPVTITVKKS